MLIPFKVDYVLPEDRIEGHLEAASIHHEKAAYYLKNGEYDKAAENAIIAKMHLDLASEARREDEHSEECRANRCVN